MSTITKIYLAQGYNKPIVLTNEKEEFNEFVLYKSKYVSFLNLHKMRVFKLLKKGVINKEEDEYSKEVDEVFASFISDCNGIRAEKFVFTQLKLDEEEGLKIAGKKFYDYSGYKEGDNALPLENIEFLYKLIQSMDKTRFAVPTQILVSFDDIDKRSYKNGFLEIDNIDARIHLDDDLNFGFINFSTRNSGKLFKLKTDLANELGDMWFRLLVECGKAGINRFVVFKDLIVKRSQEHFSYDQYLRDKTTWFSFIIERFYEDTFK